MRAVISAATPNGWYSKGHERLRKSFEPFADYATLLLFPVSLSEHRKTPYGFKPELFKAVLEDYEQVLWVDASCWFQDHPEPIFNIIDEQGYYFQRNGWSTGEWSSDECLAYFGIEREAAMSMPHMMANVIGLSHSEESTRFLSRWILAASNGIFWGDWTNEKRQVSKDDRVQGHRHDQTVGSIIINDMGLKLTNPSGYISYNVQDRNSIILTQGM